MDSVIIHTHASSSHIHVTPELVEENYELLKQLLERHEREARLKEVQTKLTFDSHPMTTENTNST